MAKRERERDDKGSCVVQTQAQQLIRKATHIKKSWTYMQNSLTLLCRIFPRTSIISNPAVSDLTPNDIHDVPDLVPENQQSYRTIKAGPPFSHAGSLPGRQSYEIQLYQVSGQKKQDTFGYIVSRTLMRSWEDDEMELSSPLVILTEDNQRCLRGVKDSLENPYSNLNSWSFTNSTPEFICNFVGVSCWND
ncbi:hypothetical protein LguiB_008657 [Lonicera macranthoides]